MNLSRKISIGNMLIVLAVGSLALYAHYRVMIAGSEEGIKSLVKTVGPIVEESLKHSMLSRDTSGLNATLRNLLENEAISRVLLVNREGLVKAGTDPDAIGTQIDISGAGQTRLEDERERAAAFAAGETFTWVQKIRNRQECHHCHRPQSQYNGAVIIDFSSTGLKREVTEHIVKESTLFLASFAVAGAGMFLLSNFVIIRRLRSVSLAMAQYRGDGREVKIDVPGSDEISALGEGFNGMVLAITASQNDMREYTDELMNLAVSTSVVAAVARTEDIHEAICHIVVKELKLRMAWIGLLKKGSYEVDPVAQCGFEKGYLSSVRITWDDSPAGMGPTGMAIKTKTPRMVSDMDSDPAYAPWRAEAAKRGYRSSMALPFLSSDGDAFGVLNLYSSETGYFTRKRIRVFVIFANQVATALENRSLIENAEKIGAELARQVKVISRSQKEWQLTFDSITDLITIHDREFRIIKANTAAAEHFGMKSEEVVGRKCYDLFHGTCSPVTNCPHATSLAENRMATEEVFDPKTSKVFSVSTFPYYSFGGEFIGSVHIAKDVTEEREKEMRLIMSERLASLGQMASGVAHEINNPLASIAGCAEGLLGRVKSGRCDAGMCENYFEIILDEIRRCKNITTSMLSLVRTSSYEKKEVALDRLLDKTIELVGFQGRLANVEIIKHYGEDVPLIFASEGELRQVFLTVIMNALDAMEDRGRLTLSATVEAGSAVVRISDTGNGIPEKFRNNVFDPFFTTKMNAGGTGLGLSIAQKIIMNHGGTISVTSDEGKGAMFVIAIPMH